MSPDYIKWNHNYTYSTILGQIQQAQQKQMEHNPTNIPLPKTRGKFREIQDAIERQDAASVRNLSIEITNMWLERAKLR
jgi:DNA-binding FadR family transcriptional regulator